MALLVGVDPGVNTGIAVWDTEEREFRLIETRTIIGAFTIVEACQLPGPDGPPDLHIFFEDARQRQWLPIERNLSEYRGKLMGAGSIRRDCEIWETYCIVHNIPYTAIPPRKGLTKWDAETFNKMTGWTGRTSNHARDAALLVWGK